MTDDDPKPDEPEAEPVPDTKERTIGLRHSASGQTVRCTPSDAEPWIEKGYEPVPHSGGHNNPPPPSS